MQWTLCYVIQVFSTQSRPLDWSLIKVPTNCTSTLHRCILILCQFQNQCSKVYTFHLNFDFVLQGQWFSCMYIPSFFFFLLQRFFLSFLHILDLYYSKCGHTNLWYFVYFLWYLNFYWSDDFTWFVCNVFTVCWVLLLIFVIVEILCIW